MIEGCHSGMAAVVFYRSFKGHIAEFVYIVAPGSPPKILSR